MSARRWKSAAERDAGRQFDRALRADRVLQTLFEVMFDQENRLRALEGRPEITRAQARAALKARYTGAG